MARPTPWRRELSAPLHVLQNEFNRLVDEYWNPARLGPTQPPVDLEPSGWSPVVDLYETPNEFILVAELPGVDPASIDLSVTGNLLTLRGVKPPENHATDGHKLMQERPFGTFHRQVLLSNEVNFDASQAEAKHGVLKVRLPKQEVAKTRTIPVQHV